MITTIQPGIDIETSVDADGTTVVNVKTHQRIYLEINGRMVAGEAEQRAARTTFWTPEGQQTTAGTTDLRGEVR